MSEERPPTDAEVKRSRIAIHLDYAAAQIEKAKAYNRSMNFIAANDALDRACDSINDAFAETFSSPERDARRPVDLEDEPA